MPILGTKVHLPRARRDLVARPRLTDLLPDLAGAHPLPRLVLVAAPAGFGKTTLLTQWLSQPAPGAGPTVAWLSLGTGDADPRRFLTGLVAALHAAGERDRSGLGVEATRLLEAHPEPSEDSLDPSLTAFLASVVNDLDARARRAVIVLDDYQAIDSMAVHEAVALLLDNLPPQVTVAMATRADPPLPLARLRARGDLLEVRAADLRFTDAEASEFLNAVMGLGLAPRHITALERRTEGWAAGLQLAALSARSLRRGEPGAGELDRFVDAFAGSHRFVLDYLLEEVLDAQPDDVRTFLLETSVLDELYGPLCDAVTGRDTGQATLVSLERANLFLIPLDDGRQWWRYHQLFADALRARLVASDPDRVQELHRRAAGWYAESGRLTDAVPHAIASGDADLTADLVELALPGLRQAREDRLLRGWLAAIPVEVARSRPLLATLTAWVRLSAGDLDGVADWLDAAQAGLHEPGRDVAHRVPSALRGEEAARQAEIAGLPAMVEVYRASAAQARGDVPATLAHARRALALVRPGDHPTRGAAAGFLGLAAWAAGDLETAVDTFGDAVRSLGAAGNTPDELGATVVLGSMWLARGRPDRAGRLYERALERASEHAAGQPGRPLATLGDLQVGLAGVQHERGDLDAAEEHLRAAERLGDAGSLPENRHRWHVVRARILRTRGDLDGAARMLDAAEALYLPGFFPDVCPIPAQRARVLIAQGRWAQAGEWAAECAGAGRPGAFEPGRPVPYLAEYSVLTLARLALAEHRAGSASAASGQGEAASLDDLDAVLDGIITAATAAGRVGSVLDARLVRALLHSARGADSLAAAELGAALAEGVPVGYRCLFLDDGEPMMDLLRGIAQGPDGDAARAAALVLAAAEAADRPAGHVGGDPAPAAGRTGDGSRAAAVGTPALLSERELEVLRLLATGLTGPEIADRLYVSVNTLRTHTKHIFAKLGVNTRRAAVLRAAELDLLPNR